MKNLGALEVGKAADILILDANPLQDIRNTRKIAKVISRGRVLNGQYHPDFRNPVPVDEKEASSHYFPTPRIQRALFDGSAAGKPAVGLTIRGSGFIPYSLVRFDGQLVKTEFVDEFRLKAIVPSSLMKPGSLPVVVENPNFGTAQLRNLPYLGDEAPFDNISNTFLLVADPGK